MVDDAPGQSNVWDCRVWKKLKYHCWRLEAEDLRTRDWFSVWSGSLHIKWQSWVSEAEMECNQRAEDPVKGRRGVWSPIRLSPWILRLRTAVAPVPTSPSAADAEWPPQRTPKILRPLGTKEPFRPMWAGEDLRTEDPRSSSRLPLLSRKADFSAALEIPTPSTPKSRFLGTSSNAMLYQTGTSLNKV